MNTEQLKHLNDLQNQIDRKKSQIRVVQRILSGKKMVSLKVYYEIKDGSYDIDDLVLDSVYIRQLAEYTLSVKKAELHRLQVAFDRIKVDNL